MLKTPKHLSPNLGGTSPPRALTVGATWDAAPGVPDSSDSGIPGYQGDSLLKDEDPPPPLLSSVPGVMESVPGLEAYPPQEGIIWPPAGQGSPTSTNEASRINPDALFSSEPSCET